MMKALFCYSITACTKKRRGRKNFCPNQTNKCCWFLSFGESLGRLLNKCEIKTFLKICLFILYIFFIVNTFRTLFPISRSLRNYSNPNWSIWQGWRLWKIMYTSSWKAHEPSKKSGIEVCREDEVRKLEFLYSEMDEYIDAGIFFLVYYSEVSLRTTYF